MGNVKLLKASAGSGKTYQLAYEYVRTVVEEPGQYRHILAVTFTNKATEEMKRRIVSEINDLARGMETPYLADLQRDLKMTPDRIREQALVARTRILHDYSRFAVLTIDKFFQRIIRSFIKELGIDLNFNLELQTGSLLTRASDMLIDEIPFNDALRGWITAFVEEKIGENKKWDVKTELAQLGREVFHERFRRSSASQVSKEELENIVSTATAEARSIINSLKSTAKQTLDIIHGNGLEISDFPYGKSGFAGYFLKISEGNIETYGGRVKDALDSDDKWCSKTSTRRAEINALIPRLRPLLRKLCDMYDANHRFLNNVELIRRNYRNFALLADLAKNLETICAADNILHISETNYILGQLIAGNDTPFIFEKAGNHFNRFMIDEFQDTSSLQWENFVPLLKNALSQSDSSPVLLVGDVKQSIYRWRGGDWRILAEEIEKEFGNLLTIDLSINYRSFSNVVDFNNNLIDKIVTADNENLNNALENAMQEGLIDNTLKTKLENTLRTAYAGHRQIAARGEGKGYINVTVYPKAEEDAESIPPIISRIEELQARGYGPGDIAVLVRVNRDAVKIAELLLEHKEKNPQSPYSYDVVTQEALLINSAAVIGFVTACFKLAAAPQETVYLAVYNRWLSQPPDLPPGDDEKQFFGTLRLLSPEEAFEAVSMRYRLNEKQSDIAYLQAFHEQIISFVSSSISDLQLFVKWWDENGADASVVIPPSDSAITISSIHKAKGLQYKVVIIPYCKWSLNPLSRTVIWADAGRAIEGLGDMPVGFNEKMRNSHFAGDYYREMVMSHVDNVNTFYVAATRAVEELHIMMPADRKRREDRINTLVLDAVASSGYAQQENDGITTYTFGEPLRYEKITKQQAVNKLFSSYASYPVADRLKLRTRTERYLENGADARLAPRDYGILMHRVFESATDSVQIFKSIDSLAASGELSIEETSALRGKVAEALRNPLVSSWFNDDWESVRNENDIITPGTIPLRRPDRVMTRGTRAVVVDYKFGLARQPSHRSQIKRYADLLRQMGYAETEAYIWYVSLNDIEKVPAGTRENLP